MHDWLAIVVAILAAVVPCSGAFAADPAAPRQRELIYLLEQDCGSCHGSTLKGGLGPPLLPNDLAGKPDEALVDAILNGRPGTPMPPWAFELSKGEVEWLVQELRNGIKK